MELANALVIGGRAIGVSSALSLKVPGISDVVICEPNEIRRNYLTEKCSLQMIHPDELDVKSYFDGNLKIIEDKWKSLKKLFKKENLSRKECILLPFKSLKRIVKN